MVSFNLDYRKRWNFQNDEPIETVDIAETTESDHKISDAMYVGNLIGENLIMQNTGRLVWFARKCSHDDIFFVNRNMESLLGEQDYHQLKRNFYSHSRANILSKSK